MPTIIDSLLVTLGLDSSKFDRDNIRVKKGLKDTGDAADDAGKRLKKAGKEGGDGFNNIAVNAAKFLAIVGGTTAIKRFVDQIVDSNASLDRLSKNIQENVSTLSAMSNAAEIAGGSADGLQNSLRLLSKAQTEWALTGEGSLTPYLSSLGLSLTDVNNKAIPVSKLLIDIGQALLAKTPDRQTAFNMGQMMGIDEGTLNLILRGRKEVELLMARQQSNNVLTKKQADESSRLRARMIESRQSFEAFGRELLSKATPALEGILDIMQSLGEWIKNNSEFVTTFLTVLTAGLVGIGVALTPINLVAVAVVGLAAGIAALYQDYQTWKRGGDSLIDWGKWEPGITAAGNAITWLKDLLGDLMYRAIAAVDAMAAISNGDWDQLKFAVGEFKSGTGKKYGGTDTENASTLGTLLENVPLPGGTKGTASMGAGWGAKLGQGVRDFFGMDKPQGTTPKQQAPAPVVANPEIKRDDRSKFIAEAAKKLNVPEHVVDAHLRSETGKTGAATIGTFNYGNIKAGSKWQGETSSRNVPEYDASGKQYTEKNAAFRSYRTPEQAAADYADMIARRFPNAKGAQDAETYAKGLKEGGYATDPLYVEKIKRIAAGTEQTYALRRIDAGVTAPIQTRTVMPMSKVPNATQAAQGAGAPNVATAQASNVTHDMSKSVETHIGEIKVYSAATDAQGVAKDMGKSMDFLFQSQANYGLM